MKCIVCGKHAVHHITRITAEGLVTINLCPEHYQQYGQIGAELPTQAGGAEEAESTSKKPRERASEEDLSRACTHCGQNFRQFHEYSKFGCPSCYTTYAEMLEPIFERLHQATQYEGKVPRGGAVRARLREEIAQLQRDKDEAVSHEDFEKAAHLRDRIRELEDEAKSE